MRGWFLKALVFATLLTVPAWAQHGGGGGGHAGGMGGGHGFAGGGHVGSPSGFHASAGFGRSSVGNGWGWRGGWNGGWRGNGWGWRGYPYRYWGGRYPYWGWNWSYGGYWYPGWGWNDDFDYSDAYPPGAYNGAGYPPPYDSSYGYLPPSGSSASYASEGEVQRIEGEVAQLRAQQATRYTEPARTPTVLIYRDGRQETVQNYAVADGTLWIFNQSRARKVPLSEINVPATQRDNEARGGEFVVPNPP